MKSNKVLFEHKIILFFLSIFKALLGRLNLASLLRGRSSKFYLTHWQELYLKSKNSSFEGKRIALLKADKLLENSLLELGSNGRTFSEKLKKARIFFQTDEAYESAWQAHKIRNRFVHGGEEPTTSEVERALFYFDKAFRGLRNSKWKKT